MATYTRRFVIPYFVSGIAPSIGYALYNAATGSAIGSRVTGMASEIGATALYEVAVTFDDAAADVQIVRFDIGAASSDVIAAETFDQRQRFVDAAVSSRAAASALPANFSVFSIDASGRVDVAKLAGTAQTARDIGASVAVGAIANNAITAASIANEAITVGKFGAGIFDGSVGGFHANIRGVVGTLVLGGWLDAAGVRSAVGLASADLDEQLSEIGQGGDAGTGDIAVNHDLGGDDNLRFVNDDGSGIDGAEIIAYLKSEYDAGLRTPRGKVFTGSDGRWIEDMNLDAGAYRFVFSRSGYMSISKEEVVSA